MKIKKAVIPAAGFGTRMLPASKAVPKEMLTLAQKPVIQYLVEEVAACEIEELLIIVSRGKGVLEDHFDYSYELEQRLIASGKDDVVKELRAISDLCEITFVRQKELLGLGHAILCAKNFTGSEPFLVILGDDVIYNGGGATASRQLMDAYEEHGTCIVGVQKVERADIASYGSIEIDGEEKKIMKVCSMVEKPEPEKAPSLYAAMGRYVLTPDIYDRIEKTPRGHGGEIQITDALKELAREGRLHACNFDGQRYDTGNLLGYLKANVEFGLRSPSGEHFKEYLKEFCKNL